MTYLSEQDLDLELIAEEIAEYDKILNDPMILEGGVNESIRIGYLQEAIGSGYLYLKD